MRILPEYLKYRIKILLLFLTAFAFPALTLSLYDLPTEPVLYAFALSGTVLGVSAVFDFVLFVRRHRRLSRVLLSVDADISVLPPPRNLPEEDLYRIISAIFEKKCAAESEKERTVSETADYYTMWVHQIKTPISAMRLLLQSGNADRAELEEQLFHIEEYVGMVLTYMRCEGHISDFVMKRFPLDRPIREAVRKYRRLFIKKGIALEYGGTEAFAVGDEKWVAFVIEQIVSNSLKYTEKGKISVCSDPALPGAICIEDTGIGISPEDLPRISEKGYTGYNGHEDKKSTGIGLYLCRQIMDRLGFSMRIESEVGVGTRVYLDFTDANLTEM